MDENFLRGLKAAANSTSQAEALIYFDQLKNSSDGWKLCGEALVRNVHRDESVKFFCFQVLEHHIKTRHPTSELENQQAVREILLTWLRNQCSSGSQDQNFLLNKAAQVFSLIFVSDYPEKWPLYFSDVLQCLQYGDAAVDMYLRILKAIDEEVVDRDVARSPPEVERNTKIKDTMRDTCITELVDSWFQILPEWLMHSEYGNEKLDAGHYWDFKKTYENRMPALTCLCLDVIGAYIEWIDIGLIANERFISTLLHHLSVDELRESACDCIHEIILKGMEPLAKKELVESLISVLEKGRVLPPQGDEDSDFLAKLSKVINAAGTQLLGGFNKLTKSGDTEAAAKCLYSAEEKMQYLFRFLDNEDDDVSQNVSGFAYSYLAVLKQISTPTETQKKNLTGLFHVIVKKMKYDESYNFEHEGEDEVMFMEYRKEMKVLFDNISHLDANLVLVSVHNMLNSTFGKLEEAKFMDVEIAVRLLYMVGEAMSTQQLYSDASKFATLQQMMTLLVTSAVSYYNHSAVTQMFFETVVRYDRFFSSQSQHIPTVLIAFLDERGLRNQNCTVRSRCSYLFSRFIKSHRANMQNYANDVLKRLQALLTVSPDNGYQHLLSADDQLFLYESAGILIAASGAVAEKQLMYMKNLLSPVIVKFDAVVQKLVSELDEASSASQAQVLYHLVAYASRASKAFPNRQALTESGCSPCFTEALPIFLRALTIPIHRDVIHSGVRQYLHRMVVCLGEDVLPFIPVAVSHMLEDCTARDIQEFIPLVNQIISRFKQHIGPFLRDVFMAIVNAIFAVLRKPADVKDVQAAKEKETLRRSYFLFIAAIVTNDVTVVLTSQSPQDMHQVLLTLIEGGVECPDPVAQKISFNILRKLVEFWGGNNGLYGFREFIYDSIVPASFLAPMKPSFDFNDAQTVLALQEIALTQKTILQKQGVEFVEFLQNKYLPTLQLSPQLIQEYTQALQHADIKTYKSYMKAFFTRVRS